MKAITVRNLPPEVARAIREKARKEGLSLNRAVTRLLAEATGHAHSKLNMRLPHRDLDKYAGLWTKEEADEFEGFLKEQRVIDTEEWK